jgi:hypothetical protein
MARRKCVVKIPTLGKALQRHITSSFPISWGKGRFKALSSSESSTEGSSTTAEQCGRLFNHPHRHDAKIAAELSLLQAQMDTGEVFLGNLRISHPAYDKVGGEKVRLVTTRRYPIPKAVVTDLEEQGAGREVHRSVTRDVAKFFRRNDSFVGIRNARAAADEAYRTAMLDEMVEFYGLESEDAVLVECQEGGVNVIVAARPGWERLCGCPCDGEHCVVGHEIGRLLDPTKRAGKSDGGEMFVSVEDEVDQETNHAIHDDERIHETIHTSCNNSTYSRCTMSPVLTNDNNNNTEDDVPTPWDVFGADEERGDSGGTQALRSSSSPNSTGAAAVATTPSTSSSSLFRGRSSESTAAEPEDIVLQRAMRPAVADISDISAEEMWELERFFDEAPSGPPYVNVPAPQRHGVSAGAGPIAT